jgi:hypothetical protein
MNSGLNSIGQLLLVFLVAPLDDVCNEHFLAWPKHEFPEKNCVSIIKTNKNCLSIIKTTKKLFVYQKNK